MTHLQALAMLLACSLLCACGNKGDLFLVPSEATEADLENVNEVLDALEGNQSRFPDLPGTEPSGEPAAPGVEELDLTDPKSQTDVPGVREDEDNKDDDDDRRKNNKS